MLCDATSSSANRRTTLSYIQGLRLRPKVNVNERARVRGPLLIYGEGEGASAPPHDFSTPSTIDKTAHPALVPYSRLDKRGWLRSPDHIRSQRPERATAGCAADVEFSWRHDQYSEWVAPESQVALTAPINIS